MDSFELTTGTYLCLQIGELRTIVLNITEGGRTTRIVLPEPYKGLPLQAERLPENYTVPEDADEKWPCVLTGSNHHRIREAHSRFRYSRLRAIQLPLEKPTQVQSNLPAQKQTKQQTIERLMRPAQLQYGQTVLAQSNAATQLRLNQSTQAQLSQYPQAPFYQPTQIVSNQPSQAQHISQTRAQSNDNDSTKIDVEPVIISAKLTKV